METPKTKYNINDNVYVLFKTQLETRSLIERACIEKAVVKEIKVTYAYNDVNKLRFEIFYGVFTLNEKSDFVEEQYVYLTYEEAESAYKSYLNTLKAEYQRIIDNIDDRLID